MFVGEEEQRVNDFFAILVNDVDFEVEVRTGDVSACADLTDFVACFQYLTYFAGEIA